LAKAAAAVSSIGVWGFRSRPQRMTCNDRPFGQRGLDLQGGQYPMGARLERAWRVDSLVRIDSADDQYDLRSDTTGNVTAGDMPTSTTRRGTPL
jgi:hypothetical protein